MGRRRAHLGGIFAAFGLAACQGVVFDERDASSAVPPRTDGGSDRADATRSETDGSADGGPIDPVDSGPSCGEGQAWCDGECTPVGDDPSNCGACRRVCNEGASCEDGECVGGSGCPPPPPGASAEAAAALARANEVRTAMGVPCQTMVTEINTAAQRHCEYYSANSGSCIANAHAEVPGCELFVAANFGDRMRMAGYTGRPAFEDMHFVGDGARAVQGWIDSVWHRTPVLSPWIRDIGYGNTEDCDTMDFGRGAETPASFVAMYPHPSQTGVPTSFDGRREGPMPPSPPTGWPSGYPITVYLRGTIESHQLRVDGSEEDIDHVWIGPGDSTLLSDNVFLYAYAPLDAATRYRVTIGATTSSGPVTLDWTFTTR